MGEGGGGGGVEGRVGVEVFLDVDGGVGGGEEEGAEVGGVGFFGAGDVVGLEERGEAGDVGGERGGGGRW